MRSLSIALDLSPMQLHKNNSPHTQTHAHALTYAQTYAQLLAENETYLKKVRLFNTNTETKIERDDGRPGTFCNEESEEF